MHSDVYLRSLLLLFSSCFAVRWVVCNIISVATASTISFLLDGNSTPQLCSTSFAACVIEQFSCTGKNASGMHEFDAGKKGRQCIMYCYTMYCLLQLSVTLWK